MPTLLSEMSRRCLALPGTLTPFLYPFLLPRVSQFVPSISQKGFSSNHKTSSNVLESASSEPPDPTFTHLNPSPSDYGRSIFADHATVTLHAGGGGHGCISFLREKYIAAGPPNGGDGGYGGNIYIQAVRGETSLHKLARRKIMRAGRGKNGQGKAKGGARGDDIVITVPVGTVVREVDRIDPVAIEEEQQKLEKGKTDGSDIGTSKGPQKWDKDKWVLYPAITPEDIASAEFPTLPRARRSHLASAQVAAPISLDLSRPMERPLLLAAGAIGGLGNPHFVTKTAPRPKFATKGEEGLTITLELELKLLADVGLVGLPNAGKSTLLRAVSNSKTRIGNWAFTTLQPNIGTVVIDDHRGRPQLVSSYDTGEPRPNFTIADIPGLIQGAHLDRGLGISFLRHVERARVLAFVVDLNAGDAITALKALWHEVGEYERMKIQEEQHNDLINWKPLKAINQSIIAGGESSSEYALETLASTIAGKPWFVVATKADLEGTKENYERLKDYIADVEAGEVEHPSGQKHGWCKSLEAIPVSAINGHGVERITEWTVGLLNE